ncbi:MAG TPA: HEAT repeat domain-containing protein, partial [Phycisphaerales bacterium]|nr:HEAT repeat domain-containing protein [Phycisphaerales bacterium]
HQDASAVPGIVPLLESDDPAVRMVAIRSLERITGQTLGYDHSADEPERRAAAERWERWVSERYAPSALDDVTGGVSGDVSGVSP